ncbi:hypothetical protein PBY51_009468 [Eleginops maclovinus]|uniref:Uncharacterized protein n=1 Tax=Eleginops maclovinus TaxID=56733 RepID=A0AAN7XX30_ELEMC|nr:hypothetical protein PBY51_009468 [Eleginops maclovinus]
MQQERDKDMAEGGVKPCPSLKDRRLRSVFLWFCLWSLAEERQRTEAPNTDRTQESCSIPLALTQDSCPSLDQI